jgi:hypothetical protein
LSDGDARGGFLDVGAVVVDAAAVDEIAGDRRFFFVTLFTSARVGGRSGRSVE